MQFRPQVIKRVFQLKAVLIQLHGEALELKSLFAGEGRQLIGTLRRTSIRAPGDQAEDHQENQADPEGRRPGIGERYSSASSVPPTPAMVATVSPSSSRMMMTPWV